MADSADLGVDVSTYVLNDEGELDLDPFGNEIAGPVVVANTGAVVPVPTPLASIP